VPVQPQPDDPPLNIYWAPVQPCKKCIWALQKQVLLHPT
jgi:hypothetical protein